MCKRISSANPFVTGTAENAKSASRAEIVLNLSFAETQFDNKSAVPLGTKCC